MNERARSERRFAWLLVAPAVAIIAAVAIVPLGWTALESFHHHDLRMPWLGRPFVGISNFAEAVRDARFLAATGHTLLFTGVTVAAEMILGLAAALAMNRAFRGRGLVRAAILLPWAIPTVVAALLWRFLFDARGGVASRLLLAVGVTNQPVVWFVDTPQAWVPIMLADIWKTTPFVALLLLAALQGIPAEMYDAAAVDGAGRWMQLRRITIPMLRPAILVALIFRTLDAFRVFDLVYVMTGGGPGTATEPIALYTFNELFQNLRFGYGAALSVIVFAVALALSAAYIHVLGGAADRGAG